MLFAHDMLQVIVCKITNKMLLKETLKIPFKWSGLVLMLV